MNSPRVMLVILFCSVDYCNNVMELRSCYCKDFPGLSVISSRRFNSTYTSEKPMVLPLISVTLVNVLFAYLVVSCTDAFDLSCYVFELSPCKSGCCHQTSKRGEIERTLSFHLILMFDHNIRLVLTHYQVSTVKGSYGHLEGG